MTNRPPAAWLSLLSPVPADVVPRRSPVASPGTAGAAPDSPIAGWESLTIDLTDLPFGTRIIMVTLDATGQPISGSDHVLHRDVNAVDQSGARRVYMRQESIGGRIEADGTFRGTHWEVEGFEPEDDDPPDWKHTPRQPTAEESRALLDLLREVITRAR